MWMDEKTRELKERISRLSDEELLQMVEVEFDDYRKEALDFARSELLARGISFEEPTAEQDVSEVIAVASEPLASERPAPRIVACAKCGSKTRLGVLLAEKEITMLFSGNDEQRFVEVYGCGKCGHIELIVDLETDVAE